MNREMSVCFNNATYKVTVVSSEVNITDDEFEEIKYDALDSKFVFMLIPVMYDVNSVRKTARISLGDLVYKHNEYKKSTTADSHYEKSSMQPLEVMQRLMSKEQFLGFLLGNVIKYTMRADFKNQKESDLRKAKTYYYWYTLALQGKIINPVKDRCDDNFVIDGVFSNVGYICDKN